MKLALRRHVRGKACQWWSGRREKFVGRNCRKKFFFSIGSDAKWSYLLPRPLGAGHYVLDVKVFDAAGNRADVFRRGVNRSVFDVVAKPSRKARAAGALGRARGDDGRWQAGRDRGPGHRAREHDRRGGVRAPVRRRWHPLRWVRSRPRCVASGSASRSATTAAAHDGNTRSSGQLFVTRIARERNSGADGWVYKIDDSHAGDRARRTHGCGQVTGCCGSTASRTRSAADVSALCASSPASRAGPPEGRCRCACSATTTSARAAPSPGARITLTTGGEAVVSAVSSADGSAVLTLPAAGRYQLAASARRARSFLPGHGQDALKGAPRGLDPRCAARPAGRGRARRLRCGSGGLRFRRGDPHRLPRLRRGGC